MRGPGGGDTILRMSKSNGYENSSLLLYFNATPISGVADNAASSPATQWFVSLHTADPGEAGNQSTNEIAFTPYARQPLARTSSGWTVSGNQVSNAGALTYPKCTGVADDTTAEYFGIGTLVSGAGRLDWSGPLGSYLGLGTATVADTITIPGLSGLSVGDKVCAISTPTATIPAGVTEGTIYFAKTVSGNDITISATSGGATLDITAAGACFWIKLGVVRVTQNIQPTIAIGQLVLTDD